MSSWAELDDDRLFAELLARRGREDTNAMAGELLQRWRRPAFYVIRRIQQSYRRGGPDDDEELFQEAACKLIDRGLDQFRGYAIDAPRGEAAGGDAGEGGGAGEGEKRPASSKTFFLRIVKHTAIDFYRRHREELAHASPDGEEPEVSHPEAEQATLRAKRANERDEAHELYWAAFARLREEHPNEAIAWDAYHHQDLDDHDAVAKLLGITVTNSYKRISRAQAHLRLYLLDLHAGTDPPRKRAAIERKRGG
jgi:RNA polymerase sigma-70 factor (ECF subfamily)